MEQVRPAEECPAQRLAEWWFRVLDNRQIDIGPRRVTARVVGIHSDGREAWIQISASRVPGHGLVLHLSEWTTLEQVTTAMKTWSVQTIRYPRVLSVLPVA
jgi:hypothetical protein